MTQLLEFERKELESIDKQLTTAREVGNAEDAARHQAQFDRKLAELYAKLTPWQKTLVARHPDRPHLEDYVAGFVEDFTPLAGDRAFGDDQAIVGGFGRIAGRRVMLIGHEKGDDTASRLRHNFGMAKPEGYRKAVRLMELADRFGLPMVTLVDTAGAFPGIQAEERAQAEAIARSTECCLGLGVPIVAAIVGEGGSGGAVALSAANRVLMFENAIYSVISPEGCASILWRTAEKASEAAAAMGITAAELARLGVIDRIIVEPVGGAHRDPATAIETLGRAIDEELELLAGIERGELRRARRDKFLRMGM